MVALNGVGTAYFDPRPAVVKFLEKTRRCGAPDWDFYGQHEFVRKFNQRNGARLVKLRRLSNVLTCKLLETCHVSLTTACVCNKKFWDISVTLILYRDAVVSVQPYG